ncbi:hypothetical protein QBC41DRAFT_284617 [Cercophora samala]|uniref:Microbial-type PARG catalytic domain-containing protein n=1 Tax=Cercophora samala TaxID=330535 RepID=A0AA40D512_9PEZI|nr:hypothetical protein QBC41DRAFT_284617 [Cercophora samala]
MPPKPNKGRPSLFRPEWESSPVNSPVKLGERPSLEQQLKAPPSGQVGARPRGSLPRPPTDTPTKPRPGPSNITKFRPPPTATAPIAHTNRPVSSTLEVFKATADKVAAERAAEAKAAEEKAAAQKALEERAIAARIANRQRERDKAAAEKAAAERVAADKLAQEQRIANKLDPGLLPRNPPRVPPQSPATPSHQPPTNPPTATRPKPPIKPILKNPAVDSHRPEVDPPSDPASVASTLISHFPPTVASPSTPGTPGTPGRVPVATSYLKRDPKKPSRKPVPGHLIPFLTTAGLLRRPPISHKGKQLPTLIAAGKPTKINPVLGPTSRPVSKPNVPPRTPTGKLPLEVERLLPPTIPASPTSHTPIKSRRVPPSFRKWPEPVMSSRDELRKVARETELVLPKYLGGLKNDGSFLTQAQQCRKYTLETFPRLDPNLCPNFTQRAKIRVINSDTLDAAIAEMTALSTDNNFGQSTIPAVVNFANDTRPGGGWLNGAMAQEESIFFRSSLSLSLDKQHYPISPNSYTAAALYSPYVLIVREAQKDGHRLIKFADVAADPKVVSVFSVAAIHTPAVTECKYDRRNPGDPETFAYFSKDHERDMTKKKMRLVLRLAAAYRHRRIILGALGCGVFKNPPEDVAHCWLEVLREKEFGGAGNWWRGVTFAVYEPKPVYEGNLDIFFRVLDGQEV